MNDRRADRLSLVEQEHVPYDAPPGSGSTMKYELSADSDAASSHAPDDSLLQHRLQLQESAAAAAAADADAEAQLGADDVAAARQLQLQHPQQPLRKCEHCRKTVLPQKQQQSCARRDGVVHVGCASSERRYEDKRLEAERAATMQRAVEEQHECIICQRPDYRRREGGGGVILREDIRWVKPCFCEVYAHHGCLSGVVTQRQHCPQCGERYTYREYGSILDFLMRYWMSYTIIGLIVGFFCLIAVYLMVNVVIYPSGWTSSRIVLLVIGLFLSSFALCCLGGCLRYTFGFRVPRFKSKYSFVRVFNYTPPPAAAAGSGSGRRGPPGKRTTASMLLTQVPRKASSGSKGRSLLMFSLPGSQGGGAADDSSLLMASPGGTVSSHDHQLTSTPKISGANVPFDFTTPSFRVPHNTSKTSFKKLEEHPLRLTLERVLEEDESSISYDDTAKESRA